MSSLPEIIPVTELRQDAAAIVRRVQQSGQPVVITQGGRVAAVIQSVDSYERTERERQILGKLIRGEREIAEGSGYDLDHVLAESDVFLAGYHSA